jgi:hypothetical protein
MERWAANTLRTLGIILTAGFVLITSLILLLFSMCAANGDFGGNKHPDQVVPYLIAAGTVLALGVWFIVWLARGIFRSKLVAEPAVAGVPTGIIPHSEPTPSVPLHLSPLGRKAIDRLVFALGAQIVLSALALIFNQLHFWSGPRIFAPFPLDHWVLMMFGPFVLYHLPYAVLIYVLLKRPDRRAFAYSLAVPAVLIMQALLSLGYFSLFARQHPIAMIVLFVPWAIHIVILVFAYQAIQQVGLRPEPASLIVAAIVTFFFFSLIQVVTPFLYRLAPR